MAKQTVEHVSFQEPTEVRDFPHGRLELVDTAGGQIGRLTLEPGWRWSEHVKPIAGTDSCQAPHLQYHVAGRLMIRMDDGTEFETGPGDILTGLVRRTLPDAESRSLAEEAVHA